MAPDLGADRHTSRRIVAVTLVALALFTTGVGARPDHPFAGAVYDIVLYNGVVLGCAAACVAAARRRTSERAAWYALAVAQLCNIGANLYYSLVLADLREVPTPSPADVLYLAYYPALYVALIALIRVRVPRFHTSMWLDGLIGALGATAVSVSVLLGPSLQLTEGVELAVVAVNLAYPVADVVLLALLFGVSAILGLRREWTLVLLGAGLVATLGGDVVYLNLASKGIYVEGGPLDLTWLVAAALTAVAASVRSDARATVGPAAEPSSRASWQVLALPMLCNVVSVAILAAGWGDRFPPVAAWSAIGCVLAGLLRTAMTFQEVRGYQAVRVLAMTDDLTGLPNRRALLRGAGQAIERADEQRPLALLLLDLDGFKEVNDSLGHPAGDELLRQVSQRISGALRPDELVARLGGDEFAVLLPSVGLEVGVQRAQDIATVLGEPFPLGDIRVHVGVSIGVATAPVPATTVSELLRCADIAMYAAKAARTTVEVYLPEPMAAQSDQLQLMEDLRDALSTDELTVHLQPQVTLAGHEVVGVEALVRWHHPTRGLLSPAVLLPVAERAGLLRPLAALVLDRALGATASWWPTHRVPVSVNLAAADVTDVDLPAKVAAALRRHGLPPEALTLELVEDSLVSDSERTRLVLGALRASGVRTSIDDFGTGYSSLSYLRFLPADELKLDGSLIVDVGRDRASAAIVKHTVALARDLGLRLVAEGIEDLSTAEALVALGCEVGQGFALARPMPIEDFRRWLEVQGAGTGRAAVDRAGALG